MTGKANSIIKAMVVTNILMLLFCFSPASAQDEIDNVQCILNYQIDLINDINECEGDTRCNRLAYHENNNLLLQCFTNDPGIEFVSCNIEAIINFLQIVPKCQGIFACVYSNYLQLILDATVCIEGLFSDPDDCPSPPCP